MVEKKESLHHRAERHAVYTIIDAVFGLSLIVSDDQGCQRSFYRDRFCYPVIVQYDFGLYFGEIMDAQGWIGDVVSTYDKNTRLVFGL